MEPRSARADEELVRSRLRVEGIVQGVGFRPFVRRLADRLGLAGVVGNDARGVFVEVEGPAEAVGEFTTRLRSEAPPLAVIERVAVSPLPATGAAGFVIVPSDRGGEREALVSPDTATCAECLGEMADPADRRFRYPFVNCTNCGPRFTIVRDVPYDRPGTTMAGFTMCDACAREYEDPTDRRFHAQPVCCPACGPRLRLVDRAGTELGGEVAGDLLDTTGRLLREGAVVAVKGLGGYHLAADAACDPAVAALRSRKHREDKPFAVMVADLADAERLCVVGRAEAETTTSAARPIVLLARRPGAAVAPSVAPGNRYLGLMLPYTGLHHLLLAAVGRPIVLTSGNVSDEPIAYADGDALDRLVGIADYFLTHDRPIHMRTDDSVARVFREREMLLRRSRGHVPRPVGLPWPFPRPVLACGAELKNTFCLAKGRRAFVSHHIGDLENYETLRSFRAGIEHFGRLFDVTPEVVAYDLHPEYLSTKHAIGLTGVELVGIQHHHAHIASCLADNGKEGPVIGVAFDGLGYGTDGTFWGGEILAADLTGFQRLGHLSAVPMPGGTAAIREPWRMAAAYLQAAYGDAFGPPLRVRDRNVSRWSQVESLARTGIGSPATSSVGRLFDAVAAVLDVRDRVNYEGQAAIELEQLADRTESGAYGAGLSGEEPFLIRGTDLVRAVVDDVRSGVDSRVVAARFHNGIAAAVVASCVRARESTGLTSVALSGGVFQNVLLLDRTVSALDAARFRVLVHSRVPPNDGGISLGQAAVAGALDRAGLSTPDTA